MNDQSSSVPSPPISSPKTSGLAIASLIFGVLGLTCILPIIGPILALVFGIIALNRINKSRGAVTGNGQAIAGLVLGGVSLLMLPIMAAMLLPALSVAREKARRAICMSNEKQIYQAVIMYNGEHNTCPRKLDDLRKYISSDKVFHCPSSEDPAKPSYQINCTTNEDEVVVREDTGDHRGAGGNVVFTDGHATWVQAQTR